MQSNQAYQKHINTKARKGWQDVAQSKAKANKPTRGKERVI